MVTYDMIEAVQNATERDIKISEASKFGNHSASCGLPYLPFRSDSKQLPAWRELTDGREATCRSWMARLILTTVIFPSTGTW